MPKYQMRVARDIRYVEDVTVEAENRTEAHRISMDGMGCHHCVKDYREVVECVQLGEPWVSGGWYDLHGPEDIVVFERAEGNRFTANDISILKERLQELGLHVIEWWNGINCPSVSFRCSGRQGIHQFREEQLKELCAPREEGDSVSHTWVIRGASLTSTRPEGTYKASRSHRGWKLKLFSGNRTRTWHVRSKAAALTLANGLLNGKLEQEVG